MPQQIVKKVSINVARRSVVPAHLSTPVDATRCFQADILSRQPPDLPKALSRDRD
jgi:hypothetical protein